MATLIRVHPSLSLEKSFGVLQVLETKLCQNPGNQLKENTSNKPGTPHILLQEKKYI